MKTFLLIITAIFLSALLLADDWADTEAVFINTDRAMKGYGFSDGKLKTTADIVNKIDEGIAKDVGSFENSEKLDSEEEFLSAAFYSTLKVEKPEMQKIITEELSVGSNGGRKLGAMWLKKRVDMGKPYDTALSYIEKQSNLTREQLLTYYRAAISSHIDSIVRQVMTNIPRKYYNYIMNGDESENNPDAVTVNAIDLIKEYYLEPTDVNYNNLLDAVEYFGKKGTESQQGLVRFRAFISIIEKLSPNLKEQLTNDLFKE
jgi:hypothetical protein